MKHHDFFELFVDELEDMYSSESQIIESLPKLIKIASLPDLKEALTHHLAETKNQVDRLDEIFSILDITPKGKTCKAMEGLLLEADEIVKKKVKSPVLDAAIISAAQKVEHYEIASYGTLRSFAKQLELNDRVADLLTEILDEEGGANKKLTKIAEGSFFLTGVNAAAVEKGKKLHDKK